MQSMDPIEAREAEIAKIAESKEDVVALHQHIREIIEGTAFKGSHRSGQFLQYIVEQAIAGNFDSLKERVIGMELFGRSPSYDTGEDAIVRVTASDVRKRLLQHYGKYGAPTEFRLTLPLGSYIPEIKSERRLGQSLPNDRLSALPKPVVPPHGLGRDSGTDGAKESAALLSAVPDPQPAPPSNRYGRLWMSFGVLIVVLNLALWGIFWNRTSHAKAAPAPTIPWPALFKPSHTTHVITSDPIISIIEGVTVSQLSVSDYANHNYIPEPNKLTPEQIRFCRALLWGDGSADTVDVPIVAGIAELAATSQGHLDVRAARSTRFADLKSDDNFIFLGSPRSNPWFSLFNDQLDFRFAFDDNVHQEIIRNLQQRPHELPAYVPTALGGGTGQSFAVIALVQNLDQNGQVLLLAGLDAEGTEAAGNFITNLPRLSDALQKCGVKSSGPIQHFELLLRLNTMASSPSNTDVVACHILPGVAAQKP
jgi:hypothetical protein